MFITVSYRVAEIDEPARTIRSRIEVSRQDGTLCPVATHILKLPE